jgi:hypothetical protein
MPSHPWVRNFSVTQDDIEYLTGILLEREIPLSSEELARTLLQQRLDQETAQLRERFKDARFYNPAHSYEVGQKIIFPALDYATGLVVGIRPGNNPDYGPFNVIAVEFEDDPEDQREFAAELTTPHELSREDGNGANPITAMSELSPDELLNAGRDEIIAKLEERLHENDDLILLAGKWFPRSLLLDVNVGHLNLAEAVLDMMGGGPLPTERILSEMGGLGDAPLELQVFSMNYALNEDPRFDEVGPAGQVLWYLSQLEPPEVLQTPAMLRYTPIEYDRSLLTPDMLATEREIGDELSPDEGEQTPVSEARATLIYPHRRLGTLPLNAQMRQIFPTARRTPRIWITLVDGQDGEEYIGWVVHNERYVVGLNKFYRKHRLPIGAHVTARKSDDPGKVIVNFTAYRPRSEWIRLIVPQQGQINFENSKRAIGAEYDELMILGADDLQAVDELFQTTQQQKKSLTSILRSIIPPLGRLTPQGTVHTKTLYSAVNVMRRCPPGPIFATLIANPDFQNVGGPYWKLSGD